MPSKRLGSFAFRRWNRPARSSELLPLASWSQTLGWKATAVDRDGAGGRRGSGVSVPHGDGAAPPALPAPEPAHRGPLPSTDIRQIPGGCATFFDRPGQRKSRSLESHPVPSRNRDLRCSSLGHWALMGSRIGIMRCSREPQRRKCSHGEWRRFSIIQPPHLGQRSSERPVSCW